MATAPAPRPAAPARTGRPGRVPAHAVTLGLIAALPVVVMPYAGARVGENPSFLPAFFAVIIAASLLTAFLLGQQFLVGGSPRLLGAAAAFLFSGLIVVPHALAFPGVITAAGPLGGQPSSSTWLWLAWHVGFPLLLALAFTGPRLLGRHFESLLLRRRAGALWVTVAGTVALTLGIGVLMIPGAGLLPVIIVQGNYASLVQLAGPWIIAANVLGLAAVALMARDGTTIERWLVVAVAASLVDVILTLFAERRFTVGWYGGRLASLIVATVVLGALIVEISRLYHQLAGSHAELAARADALSEANGELRRADHFKADLVGMLSHEVSQPLQSILGYTETAVDDWDDLDEPTRRAFVAKANQQAGRLGQVLQEVTTMCQLDAGAVTSSPIPVDLARAASTAAATLPDPDRVTLRVPPGLIAMADPVHLQRMLANLLTNALKYGAPPFEVTAGHVPDGSS